MKNLSFINATNEAIAESMRKFPKSVFFGLGADDPKKMFGSSKGLQEEFGIERVFDMPTSENAMTGVGVGLAIEGYKVIMTHLRFDFFLLAMDQLINSAAKWRFMFGGQENVPIVIRLIVGRGWGQGPTHCQNLQSWFAHVPGLKVIAPSFPADAKALLMAAIEDPNPVISIEHRWLHNSEGEVPKNYTHEKLGKAAIVKEGKDISIISNSIGTIEAFDVVTKLGKLGVDCELIDLRSLSPIDYDTIYKSVRKTGKVIVLETAQKNCSVSSEILARISEDCFDHLTQSPLRMGPPDCPVPTSFGMTKNFYVTPTQLADQILKSLKKEVNIRDAFISETPHDVPGDWFKGPF